MRTRWWAGLVSTVLATASFAFPHLVSSSATAPASPRAMWFWGNYPADEVIAWAGAENIGEIFAYVPPTVATDGTLDKLRDLRRRADAAKIKLVALGGEPDWTTDHASALAWQRAVVATGLFDGIHVDVEPYLTSTWPADTTDFLALLDALRAGSRLPIEADVPFWFDQNLADQILKRVNAVTVMSYRDTATGPNSILTISQTWLKRGAAAGKRIRLAVETAPLPDCGYCTFATDGSRRMLTVMSQVDGVARRSPGYAGFAVHAYGTWRTLRP